MAGPVPPEVDEAIVRLADGSPFMASAVLRGLVETGRCTRSFWLARGQFTDERGTIVAQQPRFWFSRLTLLPADTLQLLGMRCRA